MDTFCREKNKRLHMKPKQRCDLLKGVLLMTAIGMGGIHAQAQNTHSLSGCDISVGVEYQYGYITKQKWGHAPYTGTEPIRFLLETTVDTAYEDTKEFDWTTSEIRSMHQMAQCNGRFDFALDVTWSGGSGPYYGQWKTYSHWIVGWQTLKKSETFAVSGPGNWSGSGSLTVDEQGPPYLLHPLISLGIGTKHASITFVPIESARTRVSAYGEDESGPTVTGQLLVNYVTEDVAARTSTTKTFRETDNGVNSYGYTDALRVSTLSVPVTKEMLEARARTLLPTAWVSGWSSAPSSADGRTAKRDLYSNEFTIYLRRLHTRMTFSSQEGQTYVLSWDEVFVPEDGGMPLVTPREKMVVGASGTTVVENEWIQPPASDGVIWIRNVKATRAVDCASCPDGVPGSGATSLGSVSVRVPLGNDQLSQPAGQLELHESDPNKNLADVHWLDAIANPSRVEILKPNGYVQQVMAPQCLADVQMINSTSYRIDVYLKHQGGSFNPATGLYDLVIGAQPYVSWKIENLDGSENSCENLRVTETRGAKSYVSDYTWISANNAWTLVSGNGLKKEEFKKEWDGTELKETYTVTDLVAGHVDYMEVNRSTKSAAGFLLLRSKAIDPDGQNRLTTYTYYENLGYSYFGLPTYVIRDSGEWSWYVYDGANRITTLYHGVGNPLPPATSDTRRYESYNYSPITGSDDGSSDPRHPRRVYNVHNGSDIARVYYVITPEETRMVECYKPNLGTTAAELDDPRNRVTITKRFTTGDPWQIGKIKSVDYPNKTREAHGYSFATVGNSRQITHTIWRGAPDPANADAVLSGAKTIEVVWDTGELISREVRDFTQGVAEEVVLSRETVADADDFRRPEVITYLNGRSKTISYDCCNIESVTDVDGKKVQYLYDDLKRVQFELDFVNATEFLIYTYTYNARDQLLRKQRTSTDNAETIDLTVNEYFGDGSLKTVTLPVDATQVSTTTYSYTVNGGTGERTVTATYPDTGQRIEIYNRDGTLQRVRGLAVTRPTRYEYGKENETVNGVSMNVRFVKEIALDASGVDTLEWNKEYTSLFGDRVIKKYSAATGTPTERWFYKDGSTLLNKYVDADGVVTLYRYNTKGELLVTAVDVDQDGFVDDYDQGQFGKDRVTRSITTALASTDAQNSRGVDIRRTETEIWSIDYSDTLAKVSTTETSTDGLKTWHTLYRDASTPVESKVETTYGANGARTVKVTRPGNSYTISVYSYGRLQSITHHGSLGAQIGQAAYQYDTHGRTWKMTDARNGATTFAYNSADQVVTATTPIPCSGQSAQTTTTYYNTSRRAWKITQPDNTDIFNEYYETGLLKKTYGSRAYPVEYSYDPAGRMKTMTTWKDFNESTGQGTSGSATTVWNYNPYRGWLDTKRDADNTGPDYTYTVGGRLKTRKWARIGTNGQRILTTYTYGFDNDGISDNQHGDLVGAAYSNDPQSTPGITYTYDRRGRQKTVVHNGTTTTLTYNDANQLQTESYSGGTLNDIGINFNYDTFLRRASLMPHHEATPIFVHTYGYDSASRLQTVTHGNYNATYSYLANSPLVEQITFKENSTTRMTTTRGFDYLNRLLSNSSAPSASGQTPVSYAYGYNDANQRFRATLNDGSYWLYEYDALGQVKSGKKYWADNTPVAGQQFEYTHDDIGNRTQTKAGGDQTGANLRPANYAANTLNQYGSRDVPGAVDVMGIALPTLNVYANGVSTYRKGEYFRNQLTVANGSAPAWQSVSVAASGEITVNGNVFVPQTPENFDDPATPTVNESHDADGNQLRDGRWTYTWDAENRLVKVESLANGPLASKRKVVWEYDYLGRRIRQTTSDGSSGS